MKIAIVNTFIYPFFRGGAEKRYFDIYTRLAKKHEVHWFTIKFPEMKSSEFKLENIHVHCVMKAPKVLYTANRRGIIPSIIYAFLVFKAIWGHEFDFIDSSEFPFWHNFFLHAYCKLKKVKMFVTWLEVWSWSYWKKYLGLFGGTLGFCTQFLLSKISKNNICISKMTAYNLISRGVNPKSIYIIPGGANLDLLSKIRMSNNVKKNQIVSVGRLIPEKNFLTLIKIIEPFLQKYPSYNFMIIGEGPDREKILSLAQSLKISERIILDHGRYPYPSVMKEVAQSKVFISLSHREGFGLVLVEAKALGLITITNDHEENAGKFLIEHRKDGFIVRRDGSDLVNLLEEVLFEKKENFVNKLITNGIKSTERYDYEKIADLTLRVFEKFNRQDYRFANDL